MKVKEIALEVGCQLAGDGDLDIQSVKSAEKAGPGDITFILNKKFKAYLETSSASAFIIPANFPETEKTVIRSPNSYLTFAKVLELFYQPPLPRGPFVHSSAVVADNVVMGRHRFRCPDRRLRDRFTQHHDLHGCGYW